MAPRTKLGPNGYTTACILAVSPHFNAIGTDCDYEGLEGLRQRIQSRTIA
jgi:hypothetical protein